MFDSHLPYMIPGNTLAMEIDKCYDRTRVFYFSVFLVWDVNK